MVAFDEERSPLSEFPPARSTIPVDSSARSPERDRGRVERAEGNVAWVRWQGPSRERLLRLRPGFLFTGSNGRFCPSGLWIGRATADPTDRALLQVRVPAGEGARAVEVFVAPEEER